MYFLTKNASFEEEKGERIRCVQLADEKIDREEMISRGPPIQENKHASFAAQVGHNEGEEIVDNKCLGDAKSISSGARIATMFGRGTNFIYITYSIDSESSIQRE